MFITLAQAGAGASGAGGNSLNSMLVQLAPLLIIVLFFYFLIMRPQQRRMKAHQDMISNLKRGDVVVTSGGLIGKVKSVAEDEVRLELAPNTEVRVVRSTISEVRAKTEPAPANDSAAG